MKKKIFFLLLAIILIFFAVGLDPRLMTSHYDCTSSKIPSAFDGYRIVLLSDFHMKEFGDHEDTLIQMVADCDPDLIVLTGDFADSDHTDMTPLEDLLKGITPLAPVYYITGNHELEPEAGEQYKKLLTLNEKYGVIDLDDRTETISIGNQSILITGSQWRSYYFHIALEAADTDYFNILLYHGSDYFPSLSTYGYDLILAGHTHGGVIRLPLIGGILGNEGDLFPDYAGGSYSMNDCSMISSRGLGDAKLPRFFNRPEVVCVTLHAA